MRKYKTFKDLVFKPYKGGSKAELSFENGLGIIVYKNTYDCEILKRPYESVMITSNSKFILHAYNQTDKNVTNFMKLIQQFRVIIEEN